MRNARLNEAQVGIKIARRNINNLRYADDTTLMKESEQEPKNLLMKVKEESEKDGLKFNIQPDHSIWSHRFMENRWENSDRLSFLGHEFEQALGVGDGQGSLACCSPWSHKESDMT